MSVTHEYAITRYSFDSDIKARLYDRAFARDLWPVVYLLKGKNKKEESAYVGESIDVLTRLSNHSKDAEKSLLHELYLISGEKFNKSATLDIESNLIRYLSGDGVYKLLNGNLGLSDHSYYQKSELYREIFKDVWEEFRRLGIAKKTLADIDNSDFFKYSPYKALSTDQKKSLIMILEALVNDEKERFVVEGGAGSGKTVLAVFLFKLLQTEEDDFNFSAFGQEEKRIIDLLRRLKSKKANPKMALVIALESFRDTVQKIFQHVKGLNKQMVIGPADLENNSYDIILVDEAHRLRRRENLGPYFARFDEVCNTMGLDPSTASEVDWVLKRSDKSIFFYDEFQSVKPSDAFKETFDELKNDEKTETEYLYSQFRVKGGKKYVDLLDGLLSCKPLDKLKKTTFKEYEFLLFEDLSQLIDRIKQKNNEEQLARVVAGYAWPWSSKDDKKAYDIFIGDMNLRWNSVRKSWIHSKNAINEVGCIHTVQGYDLNYAGIIFGNEIGYNKERNEIFIRKENYHDRSGKNGVKNPEQLKGYILNIYKTLMLRGIKGTYIYICDEVLRDYFSQHVLTYKEWMEKDKAEEQQLLPFVNSVPLYDLKAAAGAFSEEQAVEDPMDWIVVKEGIKITKDHFACKVIGESMNKKIPNGSLCLFRKDAGGSREGKIVLVEHRNIQDTDFGAGYTIKSYHSEKQVNEDGWTHTAITLKPLSDDPAYQEIVLNPEETEELKVVGIFVNVLE